MATSLGLNSSAFVGAPTVARVIVIVVANKCINFSRGRLNFTHDGIAVVSDEYVAGGTHGYACGATQFSVDGRTTVARVPVSSVSCVCGDRSAYNFADDIIIRILR